MIWGWSFVSKRLIVILLTLAFASQFPVQVYANIPFYRITGETQFNTAVAIAEAYNMSTTRNIIIVNANNIPDALSAGVLAHKLDAPLLLADPATGSNLLDNYLKKHLAPSGSIYIIGGTDEILGENFLPQFPGVSVHQIAGNDRYETSALVAQSLNSGQGGTVVICSGDDFPDTLSISSFADHKSWPILFVNHDNLPGSVRDFLVNRNPTAFYIVGSLASVSYQLETRLRAEFPRAKFERFQGRDRFETAANILAKFAPHPKNIYLINGYNFAGALAGSVLAGKTGDPIILTDPNYIDLPLPIRNYVAGLSSKPAVYVLGGDMEVSDETALNIRSASPVAKKKTDFVDLQQEIPSIDVDLKYATTSNFTHTKLYSNPKAFLREGTAAKLKKVAVELEKDGYRLKIWDAYRSPEVQFKLWKLVRDSRYVANPYQGYSNHSRGSAVDLTLVDLQGNNLEMPTGFDDFTGAAARVKENANAKYLEQIMVKNGFKPLATEWWHFDDQDLYTPADSVQLPPPPVWRRNEKRTLTISALGDVTLGQDERFPYKNSFNHYYQRYGANYFFSPVKKILSRDDLTIANLEGTLTVATHQADKSSQGDQAFFFKGNPAYTVILKDGSVEAVNLANNHCWDYLDQGFSDTVSFLNKAGITCFGDASTSIYKSQGINIGLIGVNTLGKLEEGTDPQILKTQLTRQISELKANTSLVIVSFHWGTEKETEPTREQRELGRFAIDQGADLVLGHHPHIIQPYEDYKGKYIIYSLGNFVFGGNSNPGSKETEIFQQKFTFLNGKLVNIAPPVSVPCRISSRYRPEPL